MYYRVHTQDSKEERGKVLTSTPSAKLQALNPKTRTNNGKIFEGVSLDGNRWFLKVVSRSTTARKSVGATKEKSDAMNNLKKKSAK